MQSNKNADRRDLIPLLGNDPSNYIMIKIGIIKYIRKQGWDLDLPNLRAEKGTAGGEDGTGKLYHISLYSM